MLEGLRAIIRYYIIEIQISLLKNKTKDILNALSSGPVQKFILENEHTDVRDLVLKNKTLFSIPAANLSEQIGTRRKAKEKLPLYFKTAGILYPPPQNFEQCSSEVTALYKRDLMARMSNASSAIGTDLTGGFGVDTFFFSARVQRMHYVEPEPSLLELARHNHQLLGADNIIYHPGTARDFLTASADRYDFIFIDPSRRSKQGMRVSAFKDAQPDVTELQDMIFKKTSLLLIKASPLLDIQAGMRQLTSVKEIHVVSVNNECKEILLLCEKGYESDALIVAVNLSAIGNTESLRFTFEEERGQPISFGAPSTFLYEPNASILKAGAFKTIAARFHLDKIAANTHLYSAPTLVENFPGRKFQIEAVVKPDHAALKKYFPDGKANVATRNYPLSAEALKRKARLQDGGEKYLLAFSGPDKKYVVVARRV